MRIAQPQISWHFEPAWRVALPPQLTRRPVSRRNWDPSAGYHLNGGLLAVLIGTAAFWSVLISAATKFF